MHLQVFWLKHGFLAWVRRRGLCKTWSYIDEAAHPGFKMLLLFTRESLNWLNTGIFWWWIIFWLELPPLLVPFLEQFIYQANQWYQDTQLLTDTYSLLAVGFSARNKIIYCRIGRIIKWKVTCRQAVQLSRNSFGMLPVLVDLVWFEMLFFLFFFCNAVNYSCQHTCCSCLFCSILLLLFSAALGKQPAQSLKPDGKERLFTVGYGWNLVREIQLIYLSELI